MGLIGLCYKTHIILINTLLLDSSKRVKKLEISYCDIINSLFSVVLVIDKRFNICNFFHILMERHFFNFVT